MSETEWKYIPILNELIVERTFLNNSKFKYIRHLKIFRTLKHIKIILVRILFYQYMLNCFLIKKKKNHKA